MVLDPDAVRVARVGRKEFEDDQQRLVFTFETALDGEPVEIAVGVKPEPALALLMGVLDGLGFPETDIEYIANRYRRELS